MAEDTKRWEQEEDIIRMAEDTKRMENMSKTDQEDIIRKIGGAVNALALRVEAIENTLRSIQGRLEKLEQ
jgi:hypothetical protein